MNGGFIYWLVNCKSTVSVNEVDTAFDFINAHFNLDSALKEAKALSKNEDVIVVSVHKWILYSNGETDHAPLDDDDSIAYYYRNEKHREYKEV